MPTVTTTTTTTVTTTTTTTDDTGKTTVVTKETKATKYELIDSLTGQVIETRLNTKAYITPRVDETMTPENPPSIISLYQHQFDWMGLINQYLPNPMDEIIAKGTKEHISNLCAAVHHSGVKLSRKRQEQEYFLYSIVRKD